MEVEDSVGSSKAPNAAEERRRLEDEIKRYLDTQRVVSKQE